MAFYLHENGFLSEHEFWPNEGTSTFEDSPYIRGSLTFLTPPLTIKKGNSKPIYPAVASQKSTFHIGAGKYGQVLAEYSLTAFIERIGFSGRKEN